MATASVTPSTGGRGSPGPQASRALWHFPRGAALRPATCPPPSRACAPARANYRVWGSAQFTREEGRPA